MRFKMLGVIDAILRDKDQVVYTSQIKNRQFRVVEIKQSKYGDCWIAKLESINDGAHTYVPVSTLSLMHSWWYSEYIEYNKPERQHKIVDTEQEQA